RSRPRSRWPRASRPTTSARRRRTATGTARRRASCASTTRPGKPLRLQVGSRNLRKREAEGGALAFHAGGADGAAVAFGDALDRRQADAVARELFLRMQALERTEQLVGVGGREAGAVVAHEELVAVAPDLDACLRAVAGELPGVGQQVLEQVAHKVRVAGGG